ncbi:MAG: bacterial Ig-like domain-containing protein, partial [Treponema sp.]
MNKKITRSASLVAALLVAAALVFTGCPSSTDEEVTLSSISVDASSATTTYTVGDTFSSDGVVVTATYSDSTTGTIANSECT